MTVSLKNDWIKIRDLTGYVLAAENMILQLYLVLVSPTARAEQCSGISLIKIYL